MASKIWFAKESVIKLDLASNISIGTAALDTYFSTGSAIQGVMKDITVTEPIPDVDKIDLLGTDSSGFQNAELEEKPAAMVEISGTMILPGDEVSESILYGTSSQTGGTHTRYRSGIATRRKIAFLLNLDDSTDEVNYAGDNMLMTSKDVKVTGADGHYEVSTTIKGLPRDWYGPEFKN